MQVMLPDTPMSVLELFSTSKEGIDTFARRIVDEVKEGRVDALRVKLLCKTLEKIIDKIDSATKDDQLKEAGKYGDKPFEFYGAELHLTSVKTDYDYTVCNDPVYYRLTEIQKKATEQIKERQEFLKAIKTPQNFVDDETGEVYEIKPPLKKQVDGVKVTIK